MKSINAHGESLEDKRSVEKVLRSIPKKNDPITIAIEESRDLSQLTLDDLFGILKVHEYRLKKNEEPLDQDFQRKFKVDDKKKQSSTTMNDTSTFSSSSNRGGRGRGRAQGRGGRGRGRRNNLGRGNFHNSYCNKMVTLKSIVLRRKETPFKQILVKMKLKTLKLCFSHVTVLMPKMILYGI